MRHPGREPLKHSRKTLLLFEAFREGKMYLKRFGQTEVRRKVRTNRGSDKERFGQTEIQTNRGSDKQRFGQTEVRTNRGLDKLKFGHTFFFLRNWQFGISLIIFRSSGVHRYA